MRDGEMHVKGYKLSVLRMSSEDLKYHMVPVINKMVLFVCLEVAKSRP